MSDRRNEIEETDRMQNSMEDFTRQWNALAVSVNQQFREIAAVWQNAMTEFWRTPSGQYLKAVVDYYDRHPEELKAMIAAREAEARRRYCDCMCGRWNHRGACTRDATTERLFSLDGDPVTVPLCAPCAASIDAQRVPS